MYSCRHCGLEKVKLAVPARLETEDVKRWLDGTLQRIWRNHAQRSPGCMPNELTGLYIPLNKKDDTYIGAPIEKAEKKDDTLN